MRRSRGLTAARSGAAALLLVAVAAGCGSGSHPTTTSRSTTTSTNSGVSSQAASAVATAARRSASQPGERIAYTLKESGAALGQATVHGTGSFNNSPTQGQLLADVSIPSSSGELAEVGAFLSGQQLSLAVDKQIAYLKIPSSVASLVSSYTHGKSWVSLNLTQLARNPQTAGLAAIFGGQGGLTNPVQSLEDLEVAGADDVTEVGPVVFNGMATTEYRATVEVAKLAGQVQATGAAAKQALAQLKATGVSNVPFDVYIDHAGLVRFVTFSLTANIEGSSAPLSVSTDFIAYGKQPKPTIPAASQAQDLSTLLASIGG